MPDRPPEPRAAPAREEGGPLVVTESMARLYWQALQVGEPILLDDAEMARMVGRFRTYGR